MTGLVAVLEATASLLPTCAGAALVRRSAPPEERAVATNRLAWEAESIQRRLGEGPTVAALGGTIAALEPVRPDGPYPAFGRAAAALGIGGVISFPLLPEDASAAGQRCTGEGAETIGALTVYASGARLGARDRRLATVLAAHAATVIVAARAAEERREVEERLMRALATRDVIGQAKGILVERLKVTSEAAFDLLRSASQATNVKLRDLAEHLVLTGELPGAPGGPAARPTAAG